MHTAINPIPSRWKGEARRSSGNCSLSVGEGGEEEVSEKAPRWCQCTRHIQSHHWVGEVKDPQGPWWDSVFPRKLSSRCMDIFSLILPKNNERARIQRSVIFSCFCHWQFYFLLHIYWTQSPLMWGQGVLWRPQKEQVNYPQMAQISIRANGVTCGLLASPQLHRPIAKCIHNCF